MGLFSALSSVVSSVFSSVSRICGSITASFSTAIAATAPFLTALSTALPVIGQIAMAVSVIGHLLQILQPEETNEDLGDRVLQASEGGINPENYETFREYEAAIRNFELDPEKSESYSLEEKQIAGLAAQAWGIQERLGDAGLELLTKTAESPDYFTSERMSAFLDKVEAVSDVAKYFAGELGADTKPGVEAKLFAAEKALNPEKSNGDIYKELDAHA